MTNEEIVVQIQQGNTGLYLELWNNVKKLVMQEAETRYHICKGRGGVEVEDLVQCGYLAVVSAVNYFDVNDGWKFTTYLDKTLKNEFASAIGYRTEKQKREPLHTAISLETPLDEDSESGTYFDIIEDRSADFEDQVISKVWVEDLRKELERAISAIPEEQGEMIRLRYEKGLTVEQISQSKGIEQKKVRTLERKGLTSLRKPTIRSSLMRFLDDQTPYYNRVGLTAFNITGTSATEHLVIYRDMLEKKYCSSYQNLQKGEKEEMAIDESKTQQDDDMFFDLLEEQHEHG